MRCPRCGNENSDENRFCGMCGGTLLPASQPVTSGTAQGAPLRNPGGSAQLVRDSSHPNSPRSDSSQPDSPHISGPSFLGLNDPAPAASPRRRESLSIDPHSSSSSGNLTYLLDDEEEHRSGGAGKLIVFLLILVLAGGLGYYRWQHGLAPWSIAQGAKPAAGNSDATESGSSSAPSPNNSGTAAAPASQPAANPDTSNASPTNSGGGSAAEPAATNNSPANAAATNSAATNPATTNPATAAAPSGSAPATPDSAPSTEPAKSADSDSSPAVPPTKAPATAAADVPRSTRHPKPPAATPKPPAAIRSAAASDQVAEAQKYLYGRGVAQDCERGMHLLKPAAAQSNAKAYIEMGALYSAGLCTPHDLPTAYRWFALALRKDPDNQAVQADLQKLWGEMTPPERQLAIKLSQ